MTAVRVAPAAAEPDRFTVLLAHGPHGNWWGIGVTFATQDGAERVVAAIERELYVDEAYQQGVAAAETAASWTVDGNTPATHIHAVLATIDDGDDVDEYLPTKPNLSGEYADDPTPLSLARDITGDDDFDDPDLIGLLADAYDRGVSDRFYDACETELRKAVESTSPTPEA